MDEKLHILMVFSDSNIAEMISDNLEFKESKEVRIHKVPIPTNTWELLTSIMDSLETIKDPSISHIIYCNLTLEKFQEIPESLRTSRLMIQDESDNMLYLSETIPKFTFMVNNLCELSTN